IVQAQIFRTADGWLTLFITHDDFWRTFCREIGRPEWIDDERYATMVARRGNRELVLHSIGEVLATETTERWVERLAPLGIVAAGVETLETALASEQVAARGMVAEIPLDEGTLRVVGNPVKFFDADDDFRRPPLLGEHGPAAPGNAT